MASASSIISGAQGTGTFSSASDAMGGVGNMMQSPTNGKLNQMRSDTKPLDVTGQVDQFALEQAYGQDGVEIWDTLQGVQEVSEGNEGWWCCRREVCRSARRNDG